MELSQTLRASHVSCASARGGYRHALPGVVKFADLDAEELGAADEDVAAEYDRLYTARQSYIEQVITKAAHALQV